MRLFTIFIFSIGELIMSKKEYYSNDLNFCALQGGLTADARVSPSGKHISFSVASSVGKGDSKTTDYLEVQIIGNYAEHFPVDRLVKGARVNVTGRNSSYRDENNMVTDKSGKSFAMPKTYVLANSVNFLA